MLRLAEVTSRHNSIRLRHNSIRSWHNSIQSRHNPIRLRHNSIRSRHIVCAAISWNYIATQLNFVAFNAFCHKRSTILIPLSERNQPNVPWCTSGSLNRGGGENVPGIPSACATRNFTYLIRGPCNAYGPVQWAMMITWHGNAVRIIALCEGNPTVILAFSSVYIAHLVVTLFADNRCFATNIYRWLCARL